MSIFIRNLYLYIVWLLALTTISSNAQSQKHNFIATYEGVVSLSGLMKPGDSIQSNQIVGEDTVKEKVPWPSWMPETELSIISITVNINGDRIVHRIRELENGTNTDLTEKPDSLVFENGDWYKYSHSGNSILKKSTWSLEKKEETQRIRGFLCQKYILKTEDRGEHEIWVTEALPKEISPFAQSIPTNGAILEAKMSGNITYRLVDLIGK